MITVHSVKVLLLLCLLVGLSSAYGTCFLSGGKTGPAKQFSTQSMSTCCWYGATSVQSQSTCCWSNPGILSDYYGQMLQLAYRFNGTLYPKCYNFVADMLCHSCSPVSASFTIVTKDSVLVRICPTTCAMFYQACEGFAAASGFGGKKVAFCEQWSSAALFNIDEDVNAKLQYKVTDRHENCFFGEGFATDGESVELEYGNCLPNPTYFIPKAAASSLSYSLILSFIALILCITSYL